LERKRKNKTRNEKQQPTTPISAEDTMARGSENKSEPNSKQFQGKDQSHGIPASNLSRPRARAYCMSKTRSCNLGVS